MLLLTTAVIVVSTLVWIFLRHRRMTSLLRSGFKGPKPNFWFGHMRELQGTQNLDFMSKCLKEYGDTVAVCMGGTPMLISTNEEFLKTVQIKEFNSFISRYRVLGNTFPGKITESHVVATQDGQRWREMRSIMTPTFSAKYLKKMDPDMNDAISTLVKNIDKISGTEFNIYPMFQKLTMDVIGRAAFGIQTNAQLADTHPFVEQSKLMIHNRPKLWDLLFKLSLMFPEFGFILYPIRCLARDMRELFTRSAVAFLYDICSQIVSNRIKSEKRNDLLQAILDGKSRSGISLTVDSSDMSSKESKSQDLNESSSVGKSSKMTFHEVVGNAFIFMEAGYETTSTTLAYICHILVNHQDVQDRLRAEVLELLEREKQVDYNSMTDLPYMEAVIYETLRLFPPVTNFVNRVAAEDFDYKGKLIPKGTIIGVAVYQIHRKPEFWPEPEVFKPERFYKENKRLINPVHWQPFGTGPRNCIGMRFALLEIKLCLAQLLSKYRLVAGPNTELGNLKLIQRAILISVR